MNLLANLLNDGTSSPITHRCAKVYDMRKTPEFQKAFNAGLSLLQAIGMKSKSLCQDRRLEDVRQLVGPKLRLQW